MFRIAQIKMRILWRWTTMDWETFLILSAFMPFFLQVWDEQAVEIVYVSFVLFTAVYAK